MKGLIFAFAALFFYSTSIYAMPVPTVTPDGVRAFMMESDSPGDNDEAQFPYYGTIIKQEATSLAEAQELCADLGDGSWFVPGDEASFVAIMTASQIIDMGMAEGSLKADNPRRPDSRTVAGWINSEQGDVLIMVGPGWDAGVYESSALQETPSLSPVCLKDREL